MDDKGGIEEAQLLGVNYTGGHLQSGQLQRGGGLHALLVPAAHGAPQQHCLGRLGHLWAQPGRCHGACSGVTLGLALPQPCPGLLASMR